MILTSAQLYLLIKPMFYIENYKPNFAAAIQIAPNRIYVIERKEWENQGGE